PVEGSRFDPCPFGCLPPSKRFFSLAVICVHPCPSVSRFALCRARTLVLPRPRYCNGIKAPLRRLPRSRERKTLALPRPSHPIVKHAKTCALCVGGWNDRNGRGLGFSGFARRLAGLGLRGLHARRLG